MNPLDRAALDSSRGRARLLRLFESKSLGDYRGLRQRDLALRATAAVGDREADRVAAQAESDMAQLIAATEQNMLEVLNRYRAGKVNAAGFSRGLSEILQRVYYEIFLLGAQASGNPKAIRGFTGLMPQELAWVRGALATEQGFLNKLVQGIVRNKARWSVGYIRKRLRAYAETAKAVFQVGRVAGTPVLTLIHWEARGDKGTCRECFLLRDFGPYLRHTLPCTPKSGSSRCLQNCRCTLRTQPITLEQMKVYQALAYGKEYYLKLLQQSRSRPDNLPRVVGRQGPPHPRNRGRVR